MKVEIRRPCVKFSWRMAAKGRTPVEISELTDLSVEEIARFLEQESD